MTRVTSVSASWLGAPLRLVFAGAVALLLAIAAATPALLFELGSNDLEEWETSIRKLGIVLAHDVESSLGDVRRTLHDTAKDIEQLTTGSPSMFATETQHHAVFERLRQRIVGVPQVEALAILDADGNVTVTSRAYPHAPLNAADRDYFMVLRDDPSLDTYVGAPIENRVTGARSAFVGRRLRGQDGRFLGVALAVLDLSSFEAFFRSIDTGDGMAISLWRDVGVLVARHPPVSDGQIEPDIVFANHVKLLTIHEDGGTARFAGGVNKLPLLVALRRVPDLPLYITVSVPEATVFDVWHREAVPIVVGALLFCCSIVGVALLLSRQIRMEQKLRHTRSERDKAQFDLDHMVSLNKAKTEFMAHMSHELRTPLNAVIGFAELMRAECFGPLGARQYRTYAEDIGNAGQALLAAINDILDFSATSTGNLTIRRESVDVDSAIKGIIRMLQPTMELRKVCIELQALPPIPQMLGDTDRLRQILLNVVGNALKFSSLGGVVKIAVSTVDGKIMIRVIDQGRGIERDALDHVFVPFGRAQQATIANPDCGVGLGLPIAKKFTEMMGGTIAIASAVGVGTTVTLSFVEAPTAVNATTCAA